MPSLQQVYQSSQDPKQQALKSQAAESETKESEETSSSDDANAATDATNDKMGKDEFLELLTTQLKNQDPLKPMDNREFISQMAQFSSLEQMNNMNSTMGDFVKSQKISQAGNLVGKEVEMLDSDTEENVTGVIEKANVTEEETTVTVNGNQYPTTDIQQIISGE